MFGGRTLWIGSGVLALSAFFLCAAQYARQQVPRYGFTFSSVYAESLGLSAQETLKASLDAFAPAFVRLPVYWERVEPEDGVYIWDEVDAQVSAIVQAGAQVHLAVGAKVPRWPECYIPSWVSVQDRSVYERTVREYLARVVERYAPVVDVWQVENEPFFTFGNCPAFHPSFFKEEIALVRAQDPSAEIQVTVSGEQQMWTSVFSLADRVGVSLYRRVKSDTFGYTTFPVSPTWYILMRLPLFHMRTAVISELQMEPWFVHGPLEFSFDEAAQLFTPKQALQHLAFARATGFSEVSFWGVEWWYYLQQHGYPELWDTMRDALR